MYTAQTYSSTQYDIGLRNFMLQVYNYMTFALALSGLISLGISMSPALMAVIWGTPLKWIVVFAPLAMSLGFAFMIEKIHMYQEGKGKAFSYFTIVARNYLILNNNSNYKRYKDTDVMSSLPDNWDTENNWAEEVRNDEHRTFNDRMLLYWDTHLENFFQKKRDIQIADAVLELFRRANYIESFNKKSLYLLIREMTGYPTHYITKVVNKMKERQMELYNEFDREGDIKI
jgi:hypothetical protein